MELVARRAVWSSICATTAWTLFSLRLPSRINLPSRRPGSTVFQAVRYPIIQISQSSIRSIWIFSSTSLSSQTSSTSPARPRLVSKCCYKSANCAVLRRSYSIFRLTCPPMQKSCCPHRWTNSACGSLQQCRGFSSAPTLYTPYSIHALRFTHI